MKITITLPIWRTICSKGSYLLWHRNLISILDLFFLSYTIVFQFHISPSIYKGTSKVSYFPSYKKVIAILLPYIVQTTKRKPIVNYNIYEITNTQHDSIISLAFLQTWTNTISIHLNIYWKCNYCYNKWHNLKYWYVVDRHCVRFYQNHGHMYSQRDYPEDNSAHTIICLNHDMCVTVLYILMSDLSNI